MIVELLEFIRQFLGVYQPLETTLYLPIETTSVSESGEIVKYISTYASYNVPIEGIQGLNVEYLVMALIFLFVLRYPLKIFEHIFMYMLGSRKTKF